MIPKQQIEMAKRADLPRILQGLAIELVPCGKDYHLRAHDSLKLFQQDGIWLYKWWSRNGEVGDGIQYLQRHCGMGFAEAVSILSATRIIKNTASQQVKRQNLHAPGPKKKPQKWKTPKWQRDCEKLIRVAGLIFLGLMERKGFHILFMSAAFTLTRSANVVWDGCLKRDICLRNS